MISQRGMVWHSYLPSVRLILVALLMLVFSLSACSNSASVASVAITDRLNGATASPLGIQSVQASCNAGEQMVGGGYGIDSNDNGTIDVVYPLTKYVILGSYPSSATSWTVVFLNRTKGDAFPVVHVECISTSVGVQIATHAAQGNNMSVIAYCPKQSHITGGGFQVQGITNTNDVVTVTRSQPNMEGSVGDNWTTLGNIAKGSPSSFSQYTLTSYAVCATRTLTTTQGIVMFSVPSGQPNEVTEGAAKASCSSGQLLTGGGFHVVDVDGNLPISLFYPTYGTGSAYWYMKVESLPDATIDAGPVNMGGTAYIYPVCANVSQ